MPVLCPFRLGYHLQSSRSPWAREGQPSYRGVDRFLAISDYDPETASDTSSPWGRYYAALDSMELHFDRRTLERAAGGLEAIGVQVEATYVEVLAVGDIPSDCGVAAIWSEQLADVWKHWDVVHRGFSCAPQGITPMGFDVSIPVPTWHSALIHPGLDRLRPSFPSTLNVNGLCSSVSDAIVLASLANTLEYGLFPSCVLSVASVDLRPSL